MLSARRWSDLAGNISTHPLRYSGNLLVMQYSVAMIQKEKLREKSDLDFDCLMTVSVLVIGTFDEEPWCSFALAFPVTGRELCVVAYLKITQRSNEGSL